MNDQKRRIGHGILDALRAVPLFGHSAPVPALAPGERPMRRSVARCRGTRSCPKRRSTGPEPSRSRGRGRRDRCDSTTPETVPRKSLRVRVPTKWRFVEKRGFRVAEGWTPGDLDAAIRTVDVVCVLFAEAASRREWLIVCGERAQLHPSPPPWPGDLRLGSVRGCPIKGAAPSRSRLTDSQPTTIVSLISRSPGWVSGWLRTSPIPGDTPLTLDVVRDATR